MWPPDGGNTCFGARNGLRGCLSVLSYEETCRRHVVFEICNFTVGGYVKIHSQNGSVFEACFGLRKGVRRREAPKDLK